MWGLVQLLLGGEGGVDCVGGCAGVGAVGAGEGCCCCDGLCGCCLLGVVGEVLIEQEHCRGGGKVEGARGV